MPTFLHTISLRQIPIQATPDYIQESTKLYAVPLKAFEIKQEDRFFFVLALECKVYKASIITMEPGIPYSELGLKRNAELHLEL